jgi:hypothetical protein
MVATFVLGQDASVLRDVGAPLTGPVLACCLVSLAPLLLVPRDAHFLGSIWDDEANALKLSLSADGPTTIALAHARDSTKVAPVPLEVVRQEDPVLYWFGLSGPTDIIFEFDGAPGS